MPSNSFLPLIYKLINFLGGALDEEAMMKAVIPELRHQQNA